ncbi:MAG: diaminopropionate ammonia-lyase [bacterium]|nr:diaminopropionate ammonia-lyase [bacterium]MDE0416683.1 diaminopropionate ammonia-lyase [bacterium]
MTRTDAIRLHLNDPQARQRAYGESQARVMSRATRDVARQAIACWQGYAPTPLVDLPGLASHLGIGGLRIKYEGRRFGLGSFKALGGAYGVLRVLARETGRTMDDIMAGRVRDAVAGVTVCCATDGNHGRAVAWGAGLAGARCVIYLHDHVSQGREDAIAAYGADIVRVNGTYDDSVLKAAEDAGSRGWIVLSDTSWPGYEDIPSWVMQGYTVLTAEAMEQMAERRPSHVFIQAGVGGLAAAVAGPMWEDWGSARPLTVVVEPHAADCVYQSAVHGRPTEGSGSLDTVMACLSAGTISPLAWDILECGADAFVTIADRYSPQAMVMLANDAEAPLVAGESGAAGLAGLLAALEESDVGQALGLDRASDVLLVASEGATDPKIYTRIVGRRPEEVPGG